MGELSQIKSDCCYIREQEQCCNDTSASSSARKHYKTIISVTWELIEAGASGDLKLCKGKLKSSLKKQGDENGSNLHYSCYPAISFDNNAQDQ